MSLSTAQRQHRVSKADRRKHYRRMPPTLMALAVHVGHDHRRFVKGLIEDVSSGGVKLRFLDEQNVRLERGRTVYIQLRSPHLREPLVLTSTVSYAVKVDMGTIYGFRFVVSPHGHELPCVLKKVFNRRHENRVRATSAMCAVVLRSKHETAAVQISDISTSGLSVVSASSEKACSLRTGHSVEVQVRVRALRKRVVFKGMVVKRDPVASGIRFGIRIIPDSSKEFKAYQELLLQYIQWQRSANAANTKDRKHSRSPVRRAPMRRKTHLDKVRAFVGV
jgi:c-di-GMP-binding flagellar brake protein YcgR